jgi:hypothetical protein
MTFDVTSSGEVLRWANITEYVDRITGLQWQSEQPGLSAKNVHDMIFENIDNSSNSYKYSIGHFKYSKTLKRQ